MSAFIILPHQLCPIKDEILQHDIYIIEHPVMFTKYKYNKMKLVMHRSTMKCYADKFAKIHYINYDQDYKFIFKKYKYIYLYDPVDHYISSEFCQLSKNINIEFWPSPVWLPESFDYKGGRNQTNFYRFQRLKFGLFTSKMNPLTYDDQNRQSFGNKLELAKKVEFKNPNIGNKYYKEAINYVNKHFAKNPGNPEYYLAIDHDQADKLLDQFFKTKLKYFGTYEDAIHPNVAFGFHSVMSPMLNIGLIIPAQILAKIKKCQFNNNLEGYMRQIIGWREYCRFVYQSDGPMFGNRFKANKKLPNYWYYPNKPNDPISHLICKVWDLGYLHHIERLMIIGNYMNYAEFHPQECYNWFMAAFLDSYHVFMETNLLGMVMNVVDGYPSKQLLAKNGLSNWYSPVKNAKKSKIYMSNRMYICSANYIMKQGWPKGEWIGQFNKMYYHFVNKHQSYLAKNYATARNVAHWRAKSASEKRQIMKN